MLHKDYTGFILFVAVCLVLFFVALFAGGWTAVGWAVFGALATLVLTGAYIVSSM